MVLSRKVGERVLIGSDVVVQVLEMSGGRIRLGVEAPAEVGICRGEQSESLEPWLACQSWSASPADYSQRLANESGGI